MQVEARRTQLWRHLPNGEYGWYTKLTVWNSHPQLNNSEMCTASRVEACQITFLKPKLSRVDAREAF